MSANTAPATIAIPREGFTRIFLRKEIRELAWYAGAAAILFIGAYTYVATHMGQASTTFGSTMVSICMFAAYALTNAISTHIFTSEFASNTMARLIAQPVPRTVIWNRKVSLLASIMAVLIAIHLGFLLAPIDKSPHDQGHMMAAVITGMTIMIFCTGPLVALLVRQGLTALLATMLTPSIVFMIAGILRFWLDKHFEIIRTEPTLVGIEYYWWIFGTAWCIFAHWYGRRTFLRLEV